jgi:glyoxylase-like metal-dependent hydrolase (beta-lactamase superfamily II)
MTDSAVLHVLVEGTLQPDVASTCTLVLDGDKVIVVDPGLAPSQESITGPLHTLGFSRSDVTDVVISHHHPDHTINVGLFPMARIHDHWAIYDFAGHWDTVDCEGRLISANVSLMKTPGHTDEDLSTVVRAADGVYVLTHEWWTADQPIDDPYAPDLAQLRQSRARILDLANVIVPGHGPWFRPDDSTPR